MKKGQEIVAEDIDHIPFELLEHIPLNAELEEKVHRLFQQINKQMEFVQNLFQERIDKKYMVDEFVAFSYFILGKKKFREPSK